MGCNIKPQRNDIFVQSCLPSPQGQCLRLFPPDSKSRPFTNNLQGSALSPLLEFLSPKSDPSKLGSFVLILFIITGTCNRLAYPCFTSSPLPSGTGVLLGSLVPLRHPYAGVLGAQFMYLLTAFLTPILGPDSAQSLHRPALTQYYPLRLSPKQFLLSPPHPHPQSFLGICLQLISSSRYAPMSFLHHGEPPTAFTPSKRLPHHVGVEFSVGPLHPTLKFPKLCAKALFSAFLSPSLSS